MPWALNEHCGPVGFDAGPGHLLVFVLEMYAKFIVFYNW